MKKLKPIAVASLLALGMGAVQAGETVDLGDGLKLDWRLNLNYTLGTRVKNADPLLSGANNAGGNDGNNNFKKGAVTANRLAALWESKLSKGDSGFVLTASTFYDDAYHGSNDNNGALSNPNAVNKAPPFDSFTSQTKRYHGGYSRLLDTYAYTSFGLGDTSRATVRVGRQVVNWGESSYFANISAAQGPFDGTKSGIPGTEVKEAILPEDQISASIEMSPEWTLLGHAQFGFHETIAPAVGSFLSTSDLVGPGASCSGKYTATGICAGVNRGNDIRPSKTGQWGIGTRYRVTNETEVGVYYLNYKERSPTVQFAPDFRSYNIRYFDDAKLLGGTVSTTFGKVSAYGELTYRKGTPSLVGALSAPVRSNVTQLNLGGFYNVGRTPIADDMQLLGEISAVRVNSVSEGYTTDDLSFKTRNGLAFSGTWVLSYPGIFEGWDMTVPLSYSRQLRGRTLAGGVGGEGDSRFSVGVNFVRKSNLSVGVTYLGYLGSANVDPRYPMTYRAMTDRDQLSINMKYSF